MSTRDQLRWAISNLSEPVTEEGRLAKEAMDAWDRERDEVSRMFEAGDLAGLARRADDRLGWCIALGGPEEANLVRIVQCKPSDQNGPAEYDEEGFSHAQAAFIGLCSPKRILELLASTSGSATNDSHVAGRQDAPAEVGGESVAPDSSGPETPTASDVPR